jgi:hypothetical protein
MREVLTAIFAVAALVFFVLNLRKMDEVARIALRVKRKLNALATQHEFVSKLNDEIIGQASGRGGFEISKSANEPAAYRYYREARQSQREREGGRRPWSKRIFWWIRSPYE